jgi:hypothetical protein
VAICCVSLSIYLMLVKNHYKTKEIELKKWGFTNTQRMKNKRGNWKGKG